MRGNRKISHETTFALTEFVGFVSDHLNEIANTLLAHFGSFSSVLEAPEADLEPITGLLLAKLIASILPMLHLYGQDLMADVPSLRKYTTVVKLCCALFVGEKNEKCDVLCLDTRLHLLSVRLIGIGSPCSVPISPRLIVEEVVKAHAYGVILPNNHPSGDPIPSEQDVEMTMEIKDLLIRLEMRLYDHVIVGI